MIAFVLFLLLGQSPKVTCEVTRLDNGVITVTCPTLNKRKTKRYIPVESWPEQWAGRRKMGAMFPAEWISGHLVPVPDAKRLIQEMTREQPDYERNPVN